MADNVVMRATNVSKKFCRSLKHMMFYGAQDIARNAVGLSSRSDRLRDGEFWAVADVSFDLKRGETLGIIGPNGSGKSTMLKMLNGIFMPDRGKIEINGRVGALIEVGAGFHPMLSGRENIYINGSILGMSKKEIDKKFDEIVNFANIGDFLDSPVKHYSSGMYVRLGFAIAAHINPEILIIDEILSVGDLSFQNKSLRRLAEIREKANAIVFVSHNLEHVKTLCSKVLILNKGIPIFYGDTDKALIKYYEISREIILQSEGQKRDGVGLKHISTGDIELLGGGILDSDGKITKKFNQGENITLYFDFYANIKISKPYFNVGIINQRDEICIWHVSRNYNDNLTDILPGKYRLNVCFQNPQLVPGVYSFNFSLRSSTTCEFYERYSAKKFSFIVNGDSIPKGIVACDSQWGLKSIHGN
jgi:lipopolysaccharide transport system ATP-binding protein